MQNRLLFAAFLTTFAASCGSSGSGSGAGSTGADPGSSTGLTTASLDGLDLDEDGIVDLDGTVDERFTDVFSRYTAVELSSGRVHLLAESGVSDQKILRARRILEHHLTQPGAGAQGTNKSDVSSAMVDRGATLGLFETRASADLTDPDVSAIVTDLGRSFVGLSATDMVLEGTSEYLQSSPAIDTTFGATAALVYRTGLSVARPEFVAELEALMTDAISAGELTLPGSIPADQQADAFIAMLLDVHADVFAHDPDGDGAARIGDATYAFGSREDLASGDPQASALIASFFSADHSFQVELPESFDGRFDGRVQSSIPYSVRAQHLRRLRLTGDNHSEIRSAPATSILEGNAGNNKFKGRAGDDVIYGGEGSDQAIFNGPRADYEIRFEGDAVIVEDVHGGHEGTDTLYGIERLYFPDETVHL